MLCALLASAALAHTDPDDARLTAEVGALDLAFLGSVGARLDAYVGPHADLVRFDPVVARNVVVEPFALVGWMGLPHGLSATLRVESGRVHAGELEAAEALVGWESGGEHLELWIGRGDVVATRDREMELEQLALSVRPVVSRGFLPQHATGVGATVAWPERAELSLSAAWGTPTIDQPYVVGRVALHPLGELPETQMDPSDALVLQLGGGGAWVDSEAIGTRWLVAADAEARVGLASVQVTWTHTDQQDARRHELGAEIGGGVAISEGAALRTHLRGARATGLVDGEDARWIAIGRLSVLTDQVEGYAEVQLYREQGPGVTEGEDVVVLDGTAERANDVVSVGARVRW